MWKIEGDPKVSILIPNKDHTDDLEKCLHSIWSKTESDSYEVIVIENNSTDPATFAYYEEARKRYDGLKVVTYPEKGFNFSGINNFGRKAASGDYLLLLNNDVDDIVTVTEDETAAAILSLMENQKLVAEGAGAVPVAAALFHKLPIEGKKVVCLISGGNIDVNILNRVITRGLVMSGRKANLTIALEDKPGQLEKVAAIVSRCGSNVVSVLHDGSDPNMPISSCFLKLALETRDHAQIEQIRTELTKEAIPAGGRASITTKPKKEKGSKQPGSLYHSREPGCFQHLWSEAVSSCWNFRAAVFSGR